MIPTQQEKDVALQVALQMREQQRRFYASTPHTDERKHALQRARDLERDFDRITREWSSLKGPTSG